MRRARCAQLVQQELCHGVRREAHVVQDPTRENSDVFVEIVDEQRQSIETARTRFALIRSRSEARENAGRFKKVERHTSTFVETIAVH